MNLAILSNNFPVVTMTSIELVDFINTHRKAQAEAVGAPFPSKGHAKLEHADFMKKVLEVLGEHAGNFPCMFNVIVGNGAVRKSPGYRFPKREACLMAMSYSYDLQAKVFDKMTALETQQAAAPAIPTTLSAALRLAANQADQIEAQQAQLAIATPKAQALDRIADADGSMCITNAAKHLQMQPKRLFSWLAANDWIYRRPGNANWIAYQPRLKSGLLDHKVARVDRGDGTEKVVEQVLVTAKGLAKLAEVAVQ
ncbi:hypothetical protein BH10PSE16_BH10PSE16_01090 [soil metagenome]